MKSYTIFQKIYKIIKIKTLFNKYVNKYAKL